MSETDGNAAKKVKPEILDDDTSEIDDHWPSEEEHAPRERKEDQFVYTESTPPTKQVQENIGERAKEVAKHDIHISAEDVLTIRDGETLLVDLLDQQGLEHPATLHIVGGESTPSSNIYLPFKSGVACAQSSPGQTPTNRDGIMASYDEKRKRLRVLLAHGPQGDPQSADLANAAAVKGALDEISNPDASLFNAHRSIEQNLSDIGKEFGIEEKKADVLEAELQIDESLLQHLSVINPGDNHCLVLDLDRGDVRTLPQYVKRHVTREELVSLYQRLQDRVSPEGSDRLTANIEDETDRSLARSVLMAKDNPVDLAEALVRALEKEVLTEDGKKQIRTHLEIMEEEEGFTPEQIIDNLVNFFEEDAITKLDVEPGEIVIIANDELLKSVEARKGAHDAQLGNRFFLDIQSGKGLRTICEEVVAEAEERQKNEQIPDSSLSILAFEVPSGENQ